MEAQIIVIPGDFNKFRANELRHTLQYKGAMKYKIVNKEVCLILIIRIMALSKYPTVGMETPTKNVLS